MSKKRGAESGVPAKEKIRLYCFGDNKDWIIECFSGAVHKWIVLASWPTKASAERDMKLWMEQGMFERVEA